jgi:hypothetical protein
VHRFARELLIERGEEAAAYGRLADALRGRLPDDAGAAPASFRADITDMLGSVRSLFGAALAGRASLDRCQELAFRLHRYFAATNVDEGCFWLSRLLAEKPSGPWAAYATFALGYLRYWSGDTAEAMSDLQDAVRLLAGARDSYRARALIFLAGLLDDIDRGTEAVEHVRLSMEAAAPFGVDVQVSAAMGMGSVLAERGDPAAAGYAGDAIDLCRRSGSPAQLMVALPTAAMVCWQVGALEEARAYVAEARPPSSGPPRACRSAPRSHSGWRPPPWSCTPPASPATAHSASSSPPPRSSAGPVTGPPPPLSPGPSPSCGPSSDRSPRPPARSRSPSPLPAPLPCSPARRLRDMTGSRSLPGNVAVTACQVHLRRHRRRPRRQRACSPAAPQALAARPPVGVPDRVREQG